MSLPYGRWPLVVSFRVMGEILRLVLAEWVKSNASWKNSATQNICRVLDMLLSLSLEMDGILT